MPPDERDHRATVKAGDVLKECLERRLTFAAFRVPGAPPRLWAQHDPKLDLTEASGLDEEQGFVVAPFLSQMGYVHLIKPDVDISLEEETTDPRSALGTCKGGPTTAHTATPGFGRNGYIQAVLSAKEAFLSTALKKVVLARTVEVDIGKTMLPGLFLAAERMYPDALIALVHTPLHGTWIGASPERLLTVEHGRVTVDALAGTMPSEHAPGDPAQWGAKERDEQMIVTRNIVQRLERLGLRKITLDGPVVRHAGRIAHLRTTITAELSPVKAGNVPLAVHPTPAVCGEPTYEAQIFIQRHEPHHRMLYGGYWGPWGLAGRCDLHVNIRCMQVLDEQALIHAGAGITSGSDAELEWEETELKARTWTSLVEAQRRAG